MEVCPVHVELQKSVDEININLQKLFDMQVRESTITIRNGTVRDVDRNIFLVEMHETQKVILTDIKAVKEDTALWRDSSKFFKYVGGFWRRHYVAIIIVSIIALLLLDVINPIDIWHYTLSGIKNYLNIN